MVLLFPIPGYIAKMIQSVQITRMKVVCAFTLNQDHTYLIYVRPMRVCNLLQRVSIFVVNSSAFPSNSTSTAMNVLRMIKLFGWENKMNAKISEKRDEELVWLRKRLILDLINNNLK